ncbi:Protein kintoun [Nesidiocoris tenuis]|uniref:Protein kintoun n=1 Tax=Nesidiocoris tenuis TaxID=355587 RepID=A0ABN7AXF8_9HEMI|nr:Protein kintoun [Nesidiocoris tenuis]
MDRYKKEFMSGIDMSKRELNDLKEAFKKDKFKELFKEYIDEVNDPKNQAIYEKELLQLEKERGADSTFLRPSPGYVIRTSAEGDCQAFVNVCYNEKIDRPQCEPVVRNGQTGSNWSVPHVFSKGRMEMTRDGAEMLVYDVLFHPMALDLAHRNADFKELVNSTALAAVEDAENVKLDRRNARIDERQKFVGGKHPCLLRKKAKSDGAKEDIWDLPGYPYPKLEKDPESTVKELKEQPNDKEGYTTPVYIIKERKGIDLSEFRLAKDAKMLAAIPEQLIVEIRLPLIDSAADVSLDIVQKSLTLISEKPAKYKLEVTLPYHVDDDNGKAEFDKSKKILIVNLPVLRRKYEHQELQREDSGIDSDVTSRGYRSSSEEELRPMCDSIQDGDTRINENDRSLSSSPSVNERLSEEVKGKLFLDPSRAYTLPRSTITLRSDTYFVVAHVKNIDPNSVVHQFWSPNGVWVKFCSFGGGNGMFPSHQSICLRTPHSIDRRSLRIEVWDNNMICSVRLNQQDPHNRNANADSELASDKCLVGLEPNDLSEAKIVRDTDDVSENEREDSDDDDAEDELRRRPQDNDVALAEDVAQRLNLEKVPSIDDDVFSNDVEADEPTASVPNEDDTKPAAQPQRNEAAPKAADKSKSGKTENKNKNKAQQKTRTLSESSVPARSTGKRSILKCSRSLSECHADESTGHGWSSQDSNDSPDDHSGIKKTVRFSDVVSKKIFRANSSILGQRRKNEKKAKNRKRAAAERRASESEADTECETSDGISLSETSQSDVSDVSAESSDDNSTPSAPALEANKHHRRRGSKNRRKNAASAKQNYVLRDDHY